MIWFKCRQCDKTHGRADSAAGTMVFCECGQGNLVPWESTAAPAEPIADVGVPTLEPLSFEPPERPDRPVPGRRASRRQRPDPNFCLNHETTPSQTTCADCGEAFCSDCVVEVEGRTLCGPCKNFLTRSWQQPPGVSGYALVSVVLALVAGLFAPLAMRSDSVTMWLALLVQGVAVVLGGLGLRAVELNPRLGGRSLALTGILMASLAMFLTVLFSYYSPVLLS